VLSLSPVLSAPPLPSLPLLLAPVLEAPPLPPVLETPPLPSVPPVPKAPPPPDRSVPSALPHATEHKSAAQPSPVHHDGPIIPWNTAIRRNLEDERPSALWPDGAV
jgi:hypothetical protein